jgi:hypothetical protein
MNARRRQPGQDQNLKVVNLIDGRPARFPLTTGPGRRSLDQDDPQSCGTTRAEQSVSYRKGSRWRAGYVDDRGQEHARAFARKVDAIRDSCYRRLRLAVTARE